MAKQTQQDLIFLTSRLNLLMQDNPGKKYRLSAETGKAYQIEVQVDPSKDKWQRVIN
jgi:hypothetical protein